MSSGLGGLGSSGGSGAGPIDHQLTGGEGSSDQNQSSPPVSSDLGKSLATTRQGLRRVGKRAFKVYWRLSSNQVNLKSTLISTGSPVWKPRSAKAP